MLKSSLPTKRILKDYHHGDPSVAGFIVGAKIVRCRAWPSEFSTSSNFCPFLLSALNFAKSFIWFLHIWRCHWMLWRVPLRSEQWLKGEHRGWKRWCQRSPEWVQPLGAHPHWQDPSTMPKGANCCWRWWGCDGDPGTIIFFYANLLLGTDFAGTGCSSSIFNGGSIIAIFHITSTIFNDRVNMFKPFNSSGGRDILREGLDGLLGIQRSSSWRRRGVHHHGCLSEVNVLHAPE